MTSYRGDFFNSSTMVRPTLPVPPATAMTFDMIANIGVDKNGVCENLGSAFIAMFDLRMF